MTQESTIRVTRLSTGSVETENLDWVKHVRCVRCEDTDIDQLKSKNQYFTTKVAENVDLRSKMILMELELQNSKCEQNQGRDENETYRMKILKRELKTFQ